MGSTKYTREEQEKFKKIPEAVWEGLHQNPKSITHLEQNRKTKYIGDLSEIKRKDKPVWQNKQDLDVFVSRYLDLDMKKYGKDKSHNTVYKRIANAITVLRDKGEISDWRFSPSKPANIPRYGIWRVTKRKEIEAFADFKEGDYSSPANITSVIRRTKQTQFRNTLLTSFHHCLFCEFKLTPYLRAAHIVPFSIMQKCEPKNALNPINGLLLCTLCDVAFERGHITVDENYRIHHNEELKSLDESSGTNKCWISRMDEKLRIKKTSEIRPDARYLKWKLELNNS